MKFAFHGSGSSPGVVGRLGRSLFFAVFLVLGLAFFGVIASLFANSLRPLFWKTTEATILSSGVAKDDGSYRAEVRYAYRWEGIAYTSDIVSLVGASHDRASAARDRIAALTAGTVTTCRVDPSDPEHAVLELGGLWVGLFAIVPLIFACVGAGGIWRTWSGPGGRSFSGALSKSASAAWKARALPVVFGGVFLLVGGALIIWFSVPMFTRSIASSKWPATPCTIVSSRVKSHSGGDGTTYSVDIAYRYAFGGSEYEGDRYDAMGGSSSGYDGKAEVVAKYPPGSQAVCYVNPSKPSEAVLRPGFSWSVLFGLLPLLFVGVGLFVMLGGGGSATAKPEDAPTSGNSVGLRAGATPIARVLGLLIAALFWNGIVAVFAVQAIKAFQKGHPDWFLATFLVPFVVVGLALCGAAAGAVLAVFNPRVRLWVSSPAIEPGGDVVVEWEWKGKVSRIRRLSIYLEGREVASYRQGTSSATESSVFARLPIAEVSRSWMEMRSGKAVLHVPEAAAPTFEAPSNRIEWAVKVRGEIARWPDVAEAFPITVARRAGR